jgi:hypothetical protein
VWRSVRAGGGSGTFWNIVERRLASGLDRGEEVELGLELGAGEGREVRREGVAEGVEACAQGVEGGGRDEGGAAGGRGWVAGHFDLPFVLVRILTYT